MLAKLTVKNFALVSSLELEFGERLNILSGETGAGKSIIVDSIAMLVGGRYDKTMLRFGESSGYVEGVFTVTDRVREAVSDYLDDGDDEIIVLRKFNSDGKNEIRINARHAEEHRGCACGYLRAKRTPIACQCRQSHKGCRFLRSS